MPLRPTFLENLLSRLNLLPIPLFDTPLAPGMARVLDVACQLKLFDCLQKQALTEEELAKRLDCDPQGMRLLLQLLVSGGYLRERHGRYRNSKIAKRWLTSNSPFNIAPYVIHSRDIVAFWDKLPEVVHSGRQAARMPYEEDASQPETRQALERHFAGLASLAMVLGREVVMRSKLPSHAEQLLDVGGSHAAYSVLFCHKYPRLHATIIDLAPGIEAGKQTAKQQGLEDRLSFVCADIVQDDFKCKLPSPDYDVALYFHIAHLLTPELNAAVLAKVANTLRPGGILIFIDQVTGRAHGKGLATMLVQFMELTMTTVGGTCYPFSTIKTWLEEAGMEKVKRHRLIMPGATMITARKG
jgi:SAM-dependent methyltransferase